MRDRCPADASALALDADAQDIVSLNLTRAVQLCVDIGSSLVSASDVAAPGTMGETFDRLAELAVIDAALASRLKKAVGFRNIAVHNYEAVNWQIVHAIATTELDEFAQFAGAVVVWLDARKAP